MATLKQMGVYDLLKFNLTNMDMLTETFYSHFYSTYFAKWPEFNAVATNSLGVIMGYVMGKIEGRKTDQALKNWHGHVTAVTVAPQFRKIGLAGLLMKHLEHASEKIHDGFFIDLFVRSTNSFAISMYKHMGYSIYRTVKGYYKDSNNKPEDGLDMRKALPRDKLKETLKAEKDVITADELEYN
jgi:N-terminal acetyltransferase B complex catalytic subunit